MFVQKLVHRSRLAGIEVLEGWTEYFSTIGNLAFDALDNCGSATVSTRSKNRSHMAPFFGDYMSQRAEKFQTKRSKFCL